MSHGNSLSGQDKQDNIEVEDIIIEVDNSVSLDIGDIIFTHVEFVIVGGTAGSEQFFIVTELTESEVSDNPYMKQIILKLSVTNSNVEIGEYIYIDSDTNNQNFEATTENSVLDNELNLIITMSIPTLNLSIDLDVKLNPKN